jgi:Icc-related predicted phosphoesterase
MANTRIFFTSDVHGSEVCFMKFLNAAKFYEANVLILGGDITGKMIVPLVEQQDGTAVADFLGTQKIVKTKEERQALEKIIRNSGYYPYLTTPDEMERLQAEKKLVDELFSRVMAEGVKRWVGIAEERLKGTDVKCYISPGNDDRFDIDPILKGSSTVICPEEETVSIDDHHEMVTSGWANTTPWHSPREVPEEELIKKFEPMIQNVRNMETTIFNLHVPPHNTPIDLAPELDATLKPVVTGGGGVSMIHVGSTTVRQLIEKYKPLLGLHGHIHESRGFVKIGRTLCINPGSEYGEGILRGALINLDQKGLKSYIMTQG